MSSAIRNYLGSKKSYLLYPLLLACIGLVVGRLTQAWVGAVCLIIVIYLTSFIFFPWHKLIKKRQRLASLASFIVPAIICLVLFVTSWNNIINIFSNASIEQQPNEPKIELIPNPNPTEHIPNEEYITVTAEPAHGYDSYINPKITIDNPPDSPPYCSMTLEIHLTGGFKFYKLEEIPSNFQVKDGYLYSDNMTIDIKDCPSTWEYLELKIPVYHMDANTIPGSENQNVSVATTIRFEP